MSFFTWKDNGLTSDCSSLDAMASRFEETANLMKKLSKKGFKLKKTQNNQLILHPDPKVFDQWGFICLLYTSPSPRDISGSRMPSSA